MTLNFSFRINSLTLSSLSTYFFISSLLPPLSTTQNAFEKRQNDINLDSSKESLFENLSNNFFANINVDNLFFKPYSNPPQPLIRFSNFIIRHLYINESKRHYLNFINNVYTRCDATL